MLAHQSALECAVQAGSCLEDQLSKTNFRTRAHWVVRVALRAAVRVAGPERGRVAPRLLLAVEVEVEVEVALKPVEVAVEVAPAAVQDHGRVAALQRPEHLAVG